MRRRALLGALPTAALIGAPAGAQEMRVRLGTATAGGGFVVYGAALFEALRVVDPTFELRTVPTRGTAENVPLLEEGKLDMGMAFGETAHELFAGIGRPPTKLTVIAVMYSTPGMFVVRADTRYRTIDDLKGRAVVWNGRESGLATQARYAMDGLGLDMEKDFEPIYVDQLVDGPPQVIRGDAAALWGGGYRWPGFVTVANAPLGGRFIAPNAAEIDRILAKHGFMSRQIVQPGQYRGQREPIETVGSWSFILARADLEEAVGYRMAAALHKAERTGQLTKHLVETTAKNTAAAVSRREMLHPGVAKYFKEIGLLK